MCWIVDSSNEDMCQIWKTQTKGKIWNIQTAEVKYQKYRHEGQQTTQTVSRFWRELHMAKLERKTVKKECFEQLPNLIGTKKHKKTQNAPTICVTDKNICVWQCNSQKIQKKLVLQIFNTQMHHTASTNT